MKDDTPSFDFDAPDADGMSGGSTAEVRILQVGASTWNEVPQARFLSWSPAMQAAYCRDRDLDSAKHADCEEDEQFFLGRANIYDRAVRA